MKKLYRSRKNRILFGVCGGLGSYFKIDSNIIRILFIIFAPVSGVSMILYVALVLLIPNEGGKRIDEDKFKEVNEFKKRAEEKIQNIAKGIKKK
ncbi:MAG: PspC domain-containing protein [Candidatus Pacebacteria bacterium]|nr:PspC domain-containing protein [Candidatus Paceibacterota bacterium]